MYPEIELWMINDGVPELKNDSSFDVDEIMQQIIESYQNDTYTEVHNDEKRT